MTLPTISRRSLSFPLPFFVNIRRILPAILSALLGIVCTLLVLCYNGTVIYPSVSTVSSSTAHKPEWQHHNFRSSRSQDVEVGETKKKNPHHTTVLTDTVGSPDKLTIKKRAYALEITVPEFDSSVTVSTRVPSYTDTPSSGDEKFTPPSSKITTDKITPERYDNDDEDDDNRTEERLSDSFPPPIFPIPDPPEQCRLPSPSSSSSSEASQPKLHHYLYWMLHSHSPALLWFSFPVQRIPTSTLPHQDYRLCYSNEIWIQYRYMLDELITRYQPVPINDRNSLFYPYLKDIQTLFTTGLSLLEHWCPESVLPKDSPSTTSGSINKNKDQKDYLPFLLSSLSTLINWRFTYETVGTTVIHPTIAYRLSYIIHRLRNEVQDTFASPDYKPCTDYLRTLLGTYIQPWTITRKSDVYTLLDKSVGIRKKTKTKDDDDEDTIRINIVRTFSNYYESEYIQELLPFPYVDQPMVAPTALQPSFFTSCTDKNFTLLLLQSTNGNMQQDQVLDYLRSSSQRFGIVHLSDEFYKDRIDHIYRLPNVGFIVRNYYRPEIEKFASHVPCPLIQTPIGYTSGWWDNGPSHELARNRIRRSDYRPYAWIFVGNMGRANRREVIKMLVDANVGEYILHSADGYGDTAQQMPRAEYAKKARQTLFQLILWGNWNMDTFRVSEALESGSIPIVTRQGPYQSFNYWDGIYGNYHPLIQIEGWTDVALLMKTLIGRPDQLNAYRLALIDYWLNTKWWYRNQLRNLVVKSLDEQKCE